MPPDREHPSLPPPSCGNPEYYEILKKVAAEAQRGHNVNWIRALRRAMDSLSRYPLSFTQPKQAQQLANIGPAIVSVLERCIKEAGGHIEEDEADAPESQGAQEDGGKDEGQREAPLTKEKSYIPRRRSGGYALLIALHRLTERHGEGVGKIELIHEAAPLSQNSFTSPLPGSRYTAWSSMKTLREHELIHSYGRPVRYRLTERGQSLAQRLATTLAEEEGTSRVIDLCQEPRLSQASNNLQPERTLQDNPTGVHLQTPNLPTLSPLRQVHFPPKSFKKQSRLRQSGAQRVIYLIEGFSRSFPGLCPRVTLETVQSALSRLVLHHGFTIHHTTSLEGSISYLTSLTRRMMARYEGKDIMGMDEVTRTFTALSDTPFPTNPLLTYQAFQAMTEKSTGRTVKEMWLRMLVSIHGVGVDKALSISRRFPTPMR
ncbi:hypothetical protein BJ684DRAFT_8389 [Piptocephalis cylindrospora]|uniref:Crossover junction endonuclease MUS81 n=1 Tax=Piptocephalis cylindrospora TaxID=1907219 RepID=A0A4P9Y6X2_9FUNG|nr:hypothetical protein BJ684DRAFT_8389 [Piptocephalis cylindrospora]|eukprot:RKP14562.1 hypothetical protein BJ684DRAFT_8389 [Piptocephalis cylindrospora]